MSARKRLAVGIRTLSKCLAILAVALFVIWFGGIFMMGGAAQVRCSYGRISGIVIQRSEAVQLQFCAERGRQRAREQARRRP